MNGQVERLRELGARNATRVAKIEPLLEKIAELVRDCDEDCAEYDRAGGDLRLARRSFRGLVAWQRGDLGLIVCDRLFHVLGVLPSPVGPRVSPTKSMLAVAGHDLAIIETHAVRYESENEQLAASTMRTGT